MKKLLALTLLIFVPFSAYAQWNLSDNNSFINFISIKKSSIGEVHTFKKISGVIKNDTATVDIDLSSVETNIAIRNDRMKSMLFNVANFSTASISSKIIEEQLTNMKSGDIRQSKVDFTVKLHGVTKLIQVDVQLVKLTDHSILVTSTSPFILKASDFNLSQGIDALRNIAKLPSISTAVPVSFSLMFTR